MEKTEIPFLSTAELSRLIESKEVSPVEATQAYLDRIDDLDFKYNSYLTVCREQALQEAREAEAAIAQGKYLGPMHGIPVAVKDQVWTKGIRSTGGSRFLADFIPDEDSTVITNLKRAGAVLLGKTNLTEFAITGFTHRFSVPRNPWNLDMSPGGSSSGSGAATGTFLCSTSLGEDTGGSIRRPAAWSGLVGLRPSWGLVSRYGVMRGVWSMDTIGPISRTVEDAAITLQAIAGHDPKDPYSWNSPVPDYRAALDGNIRGLKVGVVRELTYADVVQSEVRDTVLTATSVLGELGADVEEVSIPLTAHANAISSVFLAVEPAQNMQDWVKNRIQDYGHDNRIGLLTGSLVPAQAYYKAQKLRILLRQQVQEALGSYDVLVSPTSGRTAVPRLEHDPVITSKETSGRLPFMRTNTYNLASSPAISVPCGFASNGLPVGLQIGSRPGAEEVIFKLAHAYEQSTPWHTMRPATL
jgi:aspartyl-tRNA(Asn)/glutamyl-tRNA(Gln) amidotransferase subunit A